MGANWSCEGSDDCGGCPAYRECMSCVYTDGSSKETTVECRATPSSIIFHLVLPIVICLVAAIGVCCTYRFWQLKRMRSQNAVFTPAVAATHGAFAATAADYDIERDVVPYLCRAQFVRRWWLTESTLVKTIQIEGALLWILGCMLLVMGNQTWSYGNGGMWHDPFMLTRVGWACFIIGGIGVLVATLWRSVERGAAARHKRRMQVEAQRASLTEITRGDQYGAMA